MRIRDDQSNWWSKILNDRTTSGQGLDGSRQRAAQEVDIDPGGQQCTS